LCKIVAFIYQNLKNLRSILYIRRMHESLEFILNFNENHHLYNEEEKQRLLKEWKEMYSDYLVEKVDSHLSKI